MRPKISIITITLNSGSTLRQAMESVINQNFNDFEYLIIDGNSTDNTLEIAKSFNDPRVKIFQAKDGGISDAMNRGISHASGDIIGILHSDDWYEPKALAMMAEAFNNQEVQWAYGRMNYVDTNGVFQWQVGIPFCLSKMKKFMLLNHPTVFCRRTLYEKLGVFHTHYRLAMDYDLCLRFSLAHSPYFVHSAIANMRIGGASSKDWRSTLSAAKEALAIKRLFFPEERVSIYLYYFWMLLKIHSRRFLNLLPFSTIFIPWIRSFINPNLAK